MENKLALLVSEGTFHVYNRANGNEKIFLSDENHRFFVKKFKLYILPVAQVYCYCLMPNHFHFLIRIKPEKEMEEFFGTEKIKKYGFEKLVSKQFSNLFSCYTQAFNKLGGRMGSLFMKNFKRKQVNDDSYFKNLVYYIHHNPLEAGLTKNISDYKYSSYYSIVKNESDFILRDDLLAVFEDLENFILFHEGPNENAQLAGMIE
jgi:putative transposase